MKMEGNCHGYKFRCPHLRRPMFHAGYTGKSGQETWWQCLFQKLSVRHVKACKLSGPELSDQEKLEASPFQKVARP